jgi:hypothetical protein
LSFARGGKRLVVGAQQVTVLAFPSLEPVASHDLPSPPDDRVYQIVPAGSGGGIVVAAGLFDAYVARFETAR